jgi:hypothetical protein
MKRHLNHVIPWIWLVAFLNFEMKGLDRDAMYFLYIAAIYALADISREKGNGAVVFYWCVYTIAVGGIFLLMNCVRREWIMVLLAGASIFALIFLLRWIWKNYI